ncbi:MAG: NAD(P)-binding domain-containing protein [Planctomycetota bacterium]|jgi:thioredoxin reductase/ferredoxin
MRDLIRRYARWLHTQWPAGHVEKLPVANEDGSTNVGGLYVVGDITGIPLLKFSSDTGARAVRTIVGDSSFQRRDRSAERQDRPVLDLVIIGGGVSGLAAAMEAKRQGLDFELLEANEPLSTLVNFPRGKPIYTYPTEMTPAGELQFSERSDVKEGLIEELRGYMDERGIAPKIARAQRVRRAGGVFEVAVDEGGSLFAHRVIVGIGRSGNFRKLGVPGEALSRVYNRLHDPKDFRKQHALVVGGGDSALETAIALAQCGAFVTLSYRKPAFSRPKPDNVEALETLSNDPFADVAVEEPVSERITTAAGGFLGRFRRPGAIRVMMSSEVREIRAEEVVIRSERGAEVIPNDVVFSMIGREPPLDFFRRSGVRIRGEWRWSGYLGLALFVLFCFWLYNWKAHLLLPGWLQPDPAKLWDLAPSGGGPIARWADDPSHLLGTLKISMSAPSFYYTLAYSLLVGVFGLRRIRRRKTPYIKVQTSTLTAIQVLPLFILPEIILPWMGHNGWFDGGALAWLADQLFPATSYGHGREYWRAVGFILAWPLFIWNVFTDHPMWLWLGISLVQTFVIIPWIIKRWGKGAYCGWICSCGALAETLGDAQRHKMPHGPVWNRVNLVGQAILILAFCLLGLRVIGWIWPGSFAGQLFYRLFQGIPLFNYAWLVDLFLAGVVGYGVYFWFSGRVWCRFACPLAALMHLYARFSQFRILADKKRCISCNVCTSVCHQGIDVMNFANKGLPMADPECVRCSACVQSCPTGVLTFGRVDGRSGEVIGRDTLPASPVLMAEERD